MRRGLPRAQGFLGRIAAAGPMGMIRMPPVVLVETLIAAAFIGLLSAWIPARSAAKMNIVEALRMVA